MIKSNQSKESNKYYFIGAILFMFIVYQLSGGLNNRNIKEIDENYGEVITWEASETNPIILEIGKVPMTFRHNATPHTIYRTQLFLDLNGERYKCWYEYGNYTRYEVNAILNSYSKGKNIKLDRISIAIANGEKNNKNKFYNLDIRLFFFSSHKEMMEVKKYNKHYNGLRYCLIKNMKFKYFEDVENIAKNRSKSSIIDNSDSHYKEILERYRQMFYN